MFLKAWADACRVFFGVQMSDFSSSCPEQESVSDFLGKYFMLSKSTYIKVGVFVHAEYAHLLPVAISSCIST